MTRLLVTVFMASTSVTIDGMTGGTGGLDACGIHCRIVDVTLDGSAKLLRVLRPGAGQRSVHHVKVRAPGAHDGRQLDRSVGRHWPCHGRYEGHHGYRSSHA